MRHYYRMGRRYTLSGTMAVGGVACVLIYMLPAVYIDDHGGRLTLSLIGQSPVIFHTYHRE